MKTKSVTRLLLALFSFSLLGTAFIGEAAARNLSYSAGNGVKCYYVLTSSVNGVNTYSTICRKGP